MLGVLPSELSLNILSYLPIPSLCSLFTLSRQWHHFLIANQWSIFHHAAILHGYVQPGLQLEDALARYTGSPWEGSIDWKDFCRRSFQLDENWEGKGRVVARLLSPPNHNVHRIKVDEEVGICITTHTFGGLSVVHLFSSIFLWGLPQVYVRSSAHCEYESGYLVFDRDDGAKEVWRLASDMTETDGTAISAPPDEEQLKVSAFAAARCSQYAPRGHFRAWAKLSFPELTHAFRLAYPTLVCANRKHVFLHDVRTGSLVQTIDINASNPRIRYVDVNERHVFVCESRAVHVYSRASGTEVLQIPYDVAVRRVESAGTISGDSFVTPLPLSPDLVLDSNPQYFTAAHVSRDGRDLVALSLNVRVFLVRDFERICRGETTLEDSGHVLCVRPEEICRYLGFEHGRVCVATLRGLYIFTLNSGPSVKAVFVRPYICPTDEAEDLTCMQLTDRRVYFTWQDMRHPIVTLYEDEENARELSPPVMPPFHEPFRVPPWLWLAEHGYGVGCIDFSLMPEE
ncbi:hypothetical protein BGW80DRAFT_158313 [Lactifluus volemus]|nr:hypothetical protein BGW80DRAFT_158313 [Lactifluus volemus]